MFYCHFPDKLLAEGEFIDENDKEQNTNSSRSLSKGRKKAGLLKRLYRMPMDWLEEKTTGYFVQSFTYPKIRLIFFSQGMQI